MKPNELIAKLRTVSLTRALKRFMSVTVQLKNENHVI